MAIVVKTGKQLAEVVNFRLRKIVEREGQRFLEILRAEVLRYYNSYEPSIYNRHWGMYNSIRIDPVEIKNNRISIRVYFEPNMATHKSLFGGRSGFAPGLINYGWSWKRKRGPYRLAYYEGFHFMRKAIDRWNRENKYGLQIQSTWFHGGSLIRRESI